MSILFDSNALVSKSRGSNYFFTEGVIVSKTRVSFAPGWCLHDAPSLIFFPGLSRESEGPR